jgi:hypothetical protein
VLDLNLHYLSDSYASEVVAVQLEASLLREILSAQTSEERLYRNTISVRHAELTDQERIGFPSAVYQPVTNDHLRGGQPIYYPTPGSQGVAVLDLYHSLESVAGVQDVLKAVLKEMVFVHRLQPGAMLTAMKTVVLQQALIEWRLLMEEEDMTEELSKKTGDEISRRPYANNFVIDDPFAIDGILDQVQAQFEYEAEQQEKTKQATKKKPGQPGKPAGKGGEEAVVQAEPRFVFNERPHPCAMTQAHMNGIEAVLLRLRLMETIYETEIVHAAYRAQAAAYNRDIKPENPVPIDFTQAFDAEAGSGRGKATPLDEVSSLGADFATRLALLEYDVQLAGFDFQTAQGLKETVQHKLFLLRKGLRLQVLDRGMYAVALDYNQPALDRCMESVILKEDGLLSAAGSRAYSGAGAGAAKRASAADIADRNAKIVVEVKKFMMDEVNKIADQFLDVRVLKQARREFVLDRFTAKSAGFGQGRHAKDLIKNLKCELLDAYCDGLLSELEMYSAKGMIARTAEMLCRVTATLPKPKLLFCQNIDPQASSISPGRPLEETDDSGRDTSIFMADLSLVNLWRLPHPLEVMEELPKESRTLTQYLDALWAVHNILQVCVCVCVCVIYICIYMYVV